MLGLNSLLEKKVKLDEVTSETNIKGWGRNQNQGKRISNEIS